MISPVGSEDGGPAPHPEEDVDQLEGDDADDVHLEVPVPDVVLGALLPPGLVDAAGVEEHDPGLDEEDVHPVDGVAQVVAHQPVHRVGLRYMRKIIN